MLLLTVLGTLSVAAVMGLPRTWQDIIPVHPEVSVPLRPGYELPHEKIVGGSVAKPHSFPWQAALFLTRTDRVYFCGGSLISLRFVLTAAHCPEDTISIEVVLGAHNIRNESEATQHRITAESYTIHENYDANLIINDIAVIKLPDNSVKLSDKIQIIALPTWSDVTDDFYGELAVVSGWGKISDDETTYTSYLHYVEAPVIDNNLCDEWYFGGIHDTNICTSGDDGKSPCNGDSGGALCVKDKVVGIVSFGVIFGCEVGFPGAYTRVTMFLEWIENNTDVVIKS